MNLDRGFISKEKLLEYLSEEDIFELVFKFKPKEYEYVTSPFRVDRNPGCWFSIDPDSNKLRFVDFANNSCFKGIKLKNMDCFDAVQVYFRLSNFYETLKFIKHHLIDNKGIQIEDMQTIQKRVVTRIKKGVTIHTEVRNFNSADKQFWTPYGISKQNLIDDKVFPIKKFKMLNTKKGDVTVKSYTLGYAFNEFDNGRKKLYFPYKEKKSRFITNCMCDDIGNIHNIPKYGDLLIISKSYKDCRVLRNQFLNCIWFQNEGMIPSEYILLDLCNRFSKIIVFFDNDKTGIESGLKINSILNNLCPGKSTQIHLPTHLVSKKITDPSDLYKKMGQLHLKQFIKQNIYESY